VNLLRLLRPRHWLKNVFVVLALIFSRSFFAADILATALGVAAFCLMASAVYVFNDLLDAPRDRLHEVKKRRPIASGAVPVPAAWVLLCALCAGALALDVFAFRSPATAALLVGYFLINAAYSAKLKHVPLADVLILSSGFMLRMFYGALVIGTPISNWLYLTTLSMSLFMAFAKRRNELTALGKNAGKVRAVLSHYNANFLDKNMLMCLTLTNVFYALWAMHMSETEGPLFIWTAPLVMVICLRYSLRVETARFADPVDVLFGDKVLLALLGLYALSMGALLLS